MNRKHKVDYSAQAQEDVQEIIRYYESQSAGLGEHFIKDLENCSLLLEDFPLMYAQYLEEIRKGNLKNFPYSFFYMPDETEALVDVLAVFSQLREPARIDQELIARNKKQKS